MAERVYMPQEVVQTIISNFLDIVRTGVLQNKKVHLRTFGSFYARKLVKGVKVHFKSANDFKESVREMLTAEDPPMEKYGVAETKSEAVLMAQVTGQCPECKAQLTSKNPPHCPNCGTKPFEEKSNGE